MSAAGQWMKLRPWLMAARPATLPAGVLPVLLATALAYGRGQARLDVALWSALGAMAIQIGTNLFNDWADFFRGADTAARVGPQRVTQRGLIAPRRVLQGAVAAFGAAAACGLFLIPIGGLPIVCVGVVSIAAGVLYTGGPYPLAYHGLGDLFVFVFFGLVATVATYYLHTGTVTGLSVLLGAAVGFFATAILVVNNLRDRHTDALAHKRTLAVRFGARLSRLQYGACLLMPYVLAAVAAAQDAAWLRLLPLVSLPGAFVLLGRIRRLEGAALNPLLGQTARLELGYTLLMALGLVL
jgi:1,4-dihydroxy-2-naphthoate octaprenyltransferase